MTMMFIIAAAVVARVHQIPRISGGPTEQRITIKAAPEISSTSAGGLKAANMQRTTTMVVIRRVTMTGFSSGRLLPKTLPIKSRPSRMLSTMVQPAAVAMAMAKPPAATTANRKGLLRASMAAIME